MANDTKYTYRSDIRTLGEVESSRQGRMIGVPRNGLPEPSSKLDGITVFYEGRFMTCDGSSWVPARLTGVNGLPAGKVLVSDENGDLVASDVDATVLGDMDFSTEGFQEQIDSINSALTGKVDVVEGKGLSTNDYTDVERAKLEGISDGAQVNSIEFITVGGIPVEITPEKAVAIPAIPDAISDLDNDLGFTTKAYVDSIRDDVYSKEQVDQQVEDLNQRILDIPVPDMRIPTQILTDLNEVGEAGIIYLVPIADEVNNTHEEYMWVEGKWEKVGSTAVILPDDTEIIVTQDSTGISIAGTALKPATENLPGYMTPTQVQTLGTNTTSISSLTDRIGRSESSISDNTSDISALKGRAATHEGDIITIKGTLSTVDARLANLGSDIFSLSGDVTALDTKVTDEIAAVREDIPTSTLDISNDSGFITLGDLPEEVAIPVVSESANGLMTPALLNKVNENSTRLDSNDDNLDGIRATLATKASQEALQAVQAEVSTLTTGLGSKASQSDLDTLESDVNDLSTDIASKATQASVDTLQNNLESLQNGVDSIGVSTSGNVVSVNGKSGNIINSVSASVDSSNQLTVSVNGKSSSSVALPSGSGASNAIIINGLNRMLTYVEVTGMSSTRSYYPVDISRGASPRTFSVTGGVAYASPAVTRSSATSESVTGYALANFRDLVSGHLIDAVNITGLFTGTIQMVAWPTSARPTTGTDAQYEDIYSETTGTPQTYTLTYDRSVCTSISGSNSYTNGQFYTTVECVEKVITVTFEIDVTSISGSFE